MSNWDESKHPRDKDGKFTDLGNMSAKDLAGKLQMPNLTKQEWEKLKPKGTLFRKVQTEI